MINFFSGPVFSAFLAIAFSAAIAVAETDKITEARIGPKAGVGSEEEFVPIFKPFKGSLKHVKTIILDPGHGGRDFGAKSRNLVLEKDFTRKIAFVLRKLIEKRNDKRVAVFLTNSGTSETDQAQRAFVANKSRGNLYLSLHAASGYDQSSRDLGIYISSRGELEKSGAKSESWKAVNGKYHTDNRVLAEKIRKNMGSFYPHKKFFIHEGKFLSLYGVDMPALLMEVIALNDPKDEIMINQEGFYKNLAQRLYTSIAQYDQTL